MDAAEESTKFFRNVLDSITRSAHNNERDFGTIVIRTQYDPHKDRTANHMSTFGVSLQQVIDALPEGTTPVDVLVGLTSFVFDTVPTDEQRQEHTQKTAAQEKRRESWERETYARLRAKYEEAED